MSCAPTPNGVATISASLPDSGSSSSPSFIFHVQQLQRKEPSGRYTAQLSDGVHSIRAAFKQELCDLADSGILMDNCLLRVTDYVINHHGETKVLMILKGEVVAPDFKGEIVAPGNGDAKADEKLEVKSAAHAKAHTNQQIVMSAAQIVDDQRGTASPTNHMGVSKRVYPIVSLNPYQGNWTIKVRVTSKSPLRTFKNARGQGNVFNVELTDEDGTQIQATMFKEAADKFFKILQLDKVYYISKGSLRMANKQYATVKNDYEMTLNISSEVVEVVEEGASSKLLSMKYSFAKIDELGQHVSAKRLVDVLGVVQSVGPLTTIRRKTTNDEVPKRDVVLADQCRQTVVLTLWNDIAVKEGAVLSEMVNETPILMAKALRLSDFQGVSLSSTMNTMVVINPVIPNAYELRTWYEQDGKTATLTPAGAGLPGNLNQTRSSFADRAVLSEITQLSVGEGKPVYFNVRAYISFIKPDQAMWYLACTTCNRKVIEESSSSYWCEGCQKHFDSCSRRYIMQAKLSDSSGEAWVSAFNEQAESLFGLSADSLSEMRNQADYSKQYEMALRKPMWQPHVYRISVAQTEYMSEKRQRITVRSVAPVDWVAESRHLLANMSKA